MSNEKDKTAEADRLQANAQKEVPLEMWGPYVSERQWGTVREDYSADGHPWTYFTHDMARSRVYRWGEDGLAGISDLHQSLCFAPSFWNGSDPILKERLFGLSNPEGNHGEDVKELYYYLDNTPTHSYMEYLYKYPQTAYPYNDLVSKNKERNKQPGEFELLDTGLFSKNNYFDITVRYAKNTHDDICIEITVKNRAAQVAELAVLPTLWFRNRWFFGDEPEKPSIKRCAALAGAGAVQAEHGRLGTYQLYFAATSEVLMTENETNTQKVFSSGAPGPFVKDAFHDALIGPDGHELFKKLASRESGTKCAPVYRLYLAAGASQTLQLRLCKAHLQHPFNDAFADVFKNRKAEANAFYQNTMPVSLSPDETNLSRQAFAGLLWNKQYYQYDVERWLDGDAPLPPPPQSRCHGRNARWTQLKVADVLSMPDKWEYPWFAAWDLCFHCIPLAMIDPEFAKNQLILLCREWYMNPQGQVPAYEWNFSAVNPPLQAWAALHIYRIGQKMHHVSDVPFLKRIFQKLMLNFTWWADLKDDNENNIFEGGFLGLDNIGVIDRASLPPNHRLEQVDATAWMGMFALNLMEIALEISQTDPSYEDAVTKFYEHFVLIAASLNQTLWDADDTFFYDRLHTPDGGAIPLKVRSIAGLSVLFSAAVITKEQLERLPDFCKRMNYVKTYRLSHKKYLPSEQIQKSGDILLSLIHKERLQQLLSLVLDENEFLSPGGIRSLSKFHQGHPFHLQVEGRHYSISYLPAESDNGMFGGNSNWRGPVWLPLNYLLVQTLYRLHGFYGEGLQIALPTGSQNMANLEQVARELTTRLLFPFLKNERGERPVHADANWFYTKPENEHLLLFYEYYNGDTAKGLGASHQTGWSALVAALLGGIAHL